MKNVEEKNDVKKIIEKRLEKNKKLFSEKEIDIIKNNKNLVTKIYLIGILDAL